jgi:F-type H+-transporting ATPase subunit a
MEEHKILIVEALNKALNWVLSLFMEIRPNSQIIQPHLLMALIAAVLIIILLKGGTRNLNIFPNKIQTLLEMVYGFFKDMVVDVMGEGGKKYIPVVGTLGLFVFTSNLLGLLPDLSSPTANLNVTVGCALFVFFYYHLQGVKKHGLLKYLKHFTGPVWYLSFIFFPIEIISHISRPVSLSLRLFVNIFGEDLVILSIATIFAYIAPVPIMAFAIFTSVLQAYIFITLSLIYLSGAVASEH